MPLEAPALLGAEMPLEAPALLGAKIQPSPAGSSRPQEWICARSPSALSCSPGAPVVTGGTAGAESTSRGGSRWGGPADSMVGSTPSGRFLGDGMVHGATDCLISSWLKEAGNVPARRECVGAAAPRSRFLVLAFREHSHELRPLPRLLRALNDCDPPIRLVHSEDCVEGHAPALLEVARLLVLRGGGPLDAVDCRCRQHDRALVRDIV
eukprot:2364195-Prymnesium_polylepis.2